MKQQIQHFTELLWQMTHKELTARYKNTIFGFLWVVVNPLIQMLVIGFVFKFFIKEPIENYYYFLLIGLLIWNFFSLSLSKATSSIVNERNLIKKAKFETEVIPLSIILSNFINLMIAILILSLPIIYSGIFSVYKLPQLIMASFMLLFFTIGLSLLTASLNVKYRDINFFVQALLIVWFYATPIIYSTSIIPTNIIWLWGINPMTSIVQAFQSALISAPSPDNNLLTINTIITTLFFLIGLKSFKKESKYFDDWL